MSRCSTRGMTKSSCFLPLDVLATDLGLSRQYLRRLAREGEIPYLDVNGRKRFDPEQVRIALRDFAAKQKQGQHEHY